MKREANPEPVDSGDELSVDEDDDAGWSDWENDSDTTESSGWEDVSSDGDELEISDSEDEEREKRKPKKAKKTDAPKDDPSAENNEGVADVEMDDSKSAVSGVTTQVSQATKKLSLLAQQKVSYGK